MKIYNLYTKNHHADWWVNWTWWGFHWGEFRWNSGFPYKSYQIGPITIRVFQTPKYKLKRREHK